MKLSLLASLAVLSLPLLAADAPPPAGWDNLFNGKDLEGWKASDKEGTFSVSEGQIIVHGPRSHLFYVGPIHNHDWTNFELTADVLTRHGANSGIYFHTEYQPEGWPDKGFEVQVNNTHTDKKRTAGLYDVKDNFDEVAKDDVWFNIKIKVEGKHVVIKVDDKVITDYTEPDNVTPPKNHPHRLIGHGTFALQGHDPNSEVHFRNIYVHALP